MSSRPRRLLVLLPVALALGVAAGAAFAVVGDGTEEPLTADQVYDDTMTLTEIAQAASGQPGQVAPPCPDVETVSRLKQAELEFGPCDPLPEDGQKVVLAEQRDIAEDGAAVKQCPMVAGSKAAHELNVGIACAEGARLVDWMPTKGAGGTCIQVTYIPSAKADAMTEELCPGDTPTVGGTPMGQLDLYHIIDGEWVRRG